MLLMVFSFVPGEGKCCKAEATAGTRSQQACVTPRRGQCEFWDHEEPLQCLPKKRRSEVCSQEVAAAWTWLGRDSQESIAMEYLSDIKKEMMSDVAAWVDLEIIIQREVSHIEKDRCCMISPSCGI